MAPARGTAEFETGEPVFPEGGADALTGLATRESFLAGVADILFNADSTEGYALIYFNLVNFKFYNARCSAERGDELLCSLANVLANEFADDLVARLSYDHFAVFTSKPSLVDSITHACRAVEGLDETNQLRLKAGIRRLAEKEDTAPDGLCDQAKSACDAIKERFGTSYLEYSPELGLALERDAYIAANIERALDNGYLNIYYQPLVRSMTNKVCAFEALARWNDPVYGKLMPSVFIPVLEKNHSISLLDKFVVKRVCEDLRARINTGKPVVPVSFNLSRADFLYGDVVDGIIDLIKRFDIPRGYLRVEVTESMFSGDEDFIMRQMSSLRSAGFEIWMDDFGAGYSSFEFLKECHFDAVKLDMQLVRDLNSRSKTILDTVVEMTKALGSKTLSEGAETQSQVEFLKSIGCEIIQGFYYGRPMPLEQCLEHCAANGFEFETPEDAEAMRKVASVSASDDEALAVLIYDGDAVSTVFGSKAFKYFVRSLGIDESDYLDALFHLAGDGALNPREFLERASKSGNAETLLLNENGRILRMAINPLASTSSYSVFTLVLEEADDANESGYLGRALGVLLRSFQGAALLDYRSDSVIVLKSRKGHTPKSFNGIAGYIKEYSETHIHPVDRGRVISKSEQVEYFAKSAESRKVNFSVMFRQRDYSGSYVLMQLMVFIPEGVGAPEALLCLKQAESAPGISIDETLEFDENNGVATTSQPKAVWGGQDAPVEDNFFDRALTDSLAVSLVEEDPDLSIQNFIGTLGKNLGADRTYVVEAAAAGVLNNTYEWCAPSVIPRKSELQNVDSTFFGSLYEQIKEHSPLLLEDVEPLKETSPKLFNYLLSRNVHATAVSVLMISGKPVGFFGIENSPAIAFDHDGMRLRTTAQFISIMIRNRNVMAHLDYLSLRDDLTGILNRRGLEQYIRTVPSGLRLVLVYADLNNLKEVNDTLGHDAGDELIKESGQTMLRVAVRGHVYRLGGDEFAMTFELDPDADCLQPMRDVRKAFIDKSISVALGYSTTVTPVKSIDELLQQADRNMYVNKQQMHQARKM